MKLNLDLEVEWKVFRWNFHFINQNDTRCAPQNVFNSKSTRGRVEDNYSNMKKNIHESLRNGAEHKIFLSEFSKRNDYGRDPEKKEMRENEAHNTFPSSSLRGDGSRGFQFYLYESKYLRIVNHPVPCPQPKMC